MNTTAMNSNGKVDSLKPQKQLTRRFIKKIDTTTKSTKRQPKPNSSQVESY